MHDPVNSSALLQLSVTLEGIEPPVWRRIVVPGHIHLGQLHDVIQCVMGWTDSHLHEFVVGERRYGRPDWGLDDDGDRLYQERNAKLGKVVERAGGRLLYSYDFGDDWRHEIVVEDVLADDSAKPRAACLAGERACPPEDVGGVYGYAEFLEVIDDPSHEEHTHFVEWAGGAFDPNALDLEAVNVRLSNLAGRWRGPRAR